MEYISKVLSVSMVTHDVCCIRLEKPEGYYYKPGQATEVALNKEGFIEEKRPFTFTGINDDLYLEFTVKCYADHDGVTNNIRQLVAGDELIIGEPWGAIEYKGQGYFIAGGAGITPFMAILRQLHKDGCIAGNTLFFSSKTSHDIIYEQELKAMLGNDALFIITDTIERDYLCDFIDEMFLDIRVSSFDRPFYICGPEPMVKSISELVTAKGADPNAVIFEK